MEYVKIANKAFSVNKAVRKINAANESTKKVSSAVDIKTNYADIENEKTTPCQHKLFQKRMLTSLAVLQTTLEKISVSHNQNLIDDMLKHRIPERIEGISIVVTQYKDRGLHTLCDEETQDLDLIVEEIECIQDQTEALMLANLLSKPAAIRL